MEEARSFQEGHRIKHPSLGKGTVVETKMEDDDRIAVIDFDDRGEKSINLQYAALTVIDDSSAS